MNKVEMLARMWIECDPNRGNNEPGSGFHADDLLEAGSLKGKPRWHWFIPRAEATLEWFEKHGYELDGPKATP
jgi:hypothetical protein